MVDLGWITWVSKVVFAMDSRIYVFGLPEWSPCRKFLDLKDPSEK